MKKIKHFLAAYGGDLLVAAGASAITVGVWLIHPAAGLIVGGVLAMALGVILCMGGEDHEPSA